MPLVYVQRYAPQTFTDKVTQYLDSGTTLVFNDPTFIDMTNAALFESAGTYILYDLTAGATFNNPSTQLGYMQFLLPQGYQVEAGFPKYEDQQIKVRLTTASTLLAFNGTQYVVGGPIVFKDHIAITLDAGVYTAAGEYVLVDYSQATGVPDIVLTNVTVTPSAGRVFVSLSNDTATKQIKVTLS